MPNFTDFDSFLVTNCKLYLLQKIENLKIIRVLHHNTQNTQVKFQFKEQPCSYAVGDWVLVTLGLHESSLQIKVIEQATGYFK